jgi:hypothetical protein
MAATRSRKKAASSVKAGTKAKAPAELERGTARAGSPQPVMGAATGTMSAPFAQQAGGATAAWAFPPSVTALPQAPGGAAFQPGITQAGAVSAGSLSETLGSTLRLGVDVVNAGLVGVLNVLGGLAASRASAPAESDPHGPGENLAATARTDPISRCDLTGGVRPGRAGIDSWLSGLESGTVGSLTCRVGARGYSHAAGRGCAVSH